MTKSLSERIALHTDKSKNTDKQFLPVFIALKPEIVQALADGWTVRQVWATLQHEKRIKCSYQWFRTLVNRHVFEDKKKDQHVDQSKSTPNDQEGFRFISATEKEELI